MSTIGNGFKALIIVLGVLCLIGLLYVLSPLLAALGSGLLVLIGIMAPILLVALAVGLLYKYLESKE